MTDARDLPPLPPMERLVELMFDAARTGRDEMIPALLQAGVDIEVTDAKGYTPLVIASYNGQAEATAALLAAGALHTYVVQLSMTTLRAHTTLAGRTTVAFVAAASLFPLMSLIVRPRDCR